MLPPPHEPLTTRMSSKGQIVIPRRACDALGVHAGTEFVLRIDEDGYKLIPKKKTMDEFLALHRAYGSKAKRATSADAKEEIGDHLLEKDEHSRKQAKKAFTARKKKR